MVVHVSFTREPEQRLDHVHESLTRGDLHVHDRVDVALVPPVMPDAGLDVGLFAGSHQRPLTVAQHRQLALPDAEALLQRGVQVLTDNAGTGTRRQVDDHTALRVQPRQLDDDRTLQRLRAY